MNINILFLSFLETYLSDIWQLTQNDNITVTTTVYDVYLAVGYGVYFVGFCFQIYYDLYNC